MSKLILVRHGQSIWNLENRFTGWYDVELSENGILEAQKAGELLKAENINIDHAYTSYLKRADNTLKIILKNMSLKNMNIIKSWEFNERHYGSLTGLNKAEMKEKLGENQIKIYRRSWDIAPPELEKNNDFNPRSDKIYNNIDSRFIPNTESLKDTYDRVIPYFDLNIKTKIIDGKNIIIAAHGNSLRALCKKLFNISNDKINELEIPTGNPLVINLDAGLKVLNAVYLDGNRKQKLIINQ
ncbi:MAG: 2,3-diphosphoglycerate-dependent phosphoglycerate mutase [Alphaproteobacteria bacterium]|nr:2,3-diphosphoglycerate-dependent phosphoglycerate mutase [Alphaproteobacteria bacterium]